MKQKMKLKRVLQIISLSMFNLMIMTTQVFAADEDHVLTDLYDTEAFRGSWRWFDKFNWLGGILNFIISAICFIGLFSIVLQIIITLCYFSQRGFWNNVHDIKVQHAGSTMFGKQMPFGLAGYFTETVMPTKTSGIDALFNLFYAFIPDIKEYSEMGENRESNLSEDESVTTWLIKTLPRKVLIMLLFSMGFNGSLMRCYGVIVDGLGVFTERIADYNSVALVNNILNSGDNYEFSLGSSGKGLDDLQGRVCDAAYKECIAECDPESLDAASRRAVGVAIENWVKDNMVSDRIDAYLRKANFITSSDYVMTDEDFEKTKVKCWISDTNTTDESKARIAFDVSNVLNAKQSGNKYIVVQLTLKERTPAHNYLNIDKSDEE